MKRIIFAFSLIFITACSDDNAPIDYTQANEDEIIQFIADNNLNAQRSSSGLYYVISEQGMGAQPNSTNNVTVAYKGYFTNGSVFDESDSDGISFSLQQVIAGWTEGITYFNEGGNGVLLIPSHLAYGNNGRGSIPGGTVLIFDIELISVN